MYIEKSLISYNLLRIVLKNLELHVTFSQAQIDGVSTG